MVSVFIISLSVAFGFSFLCSLLEATLLSLTPGQMAELADRNPKSAKLWEYFKKNIEKAIAGILSLNTISHTMGATIAGAEANVLFGNNFVTVFSIAFTYLMLQFTEILPKTLGVRFNVLLAPYLGIILLVMMRSFSPLVWLLHVINRPFEGRKNANGPVPTLEEIKALAGLALSNKLISSYQEKIIKQAVRLSRMKAQDVAIPMEQITFLSDNQSLSQAIITAHMDPHTRFPVVHEKDKNTVLGYINFKELVYRVRTNPADPTLKGIIRPVRFINENMSCTEVLKAFIDEHSHMAIIQDADGKTSGLITLEDVVEELVGEIEDEFDRVPRFIQSLTKNVWLLGGGVPTSEVAIKTGMDFQDAKGSISSWIIEYLKRVPALGENIVVGDMAFNIRRIRRGQIFELMITPKEHMPPPL